MPADRLLHPGRCNRDCLDIVRRSCRNRKRHSERPAARTSKRYSDAFERAQISAIAGSPSAPGDSRRAFESLASPSRLLPFWLFGLFGCTAPSDRSRLAFAGGNFATCLDAPAKRLHQVDDVCGLTPLWPLNRLAFLLFLEQVLERILVAVIELARIEVARLRLDNVRGKFEHILGNLFIG